MADTKARWRAAQEYEKNWWSGYNRAPEFYTAFSELVTELTGPYLELGESTRILEVGSGAAGSVTAIDYGRKFAVDPLELFFREQKHFRQVRDPGVIYLSAKGEELPFEESEFELVIMDNVLDHCESPEKVFSEIVRVLAPGGVFFLRQNVYHGWGRLLRNCLETLSIDKGHPHTFGESKLTEISERFGLRIVERRQVGFFKGWLNDLSRGGLKGWFQALLFMTRNRLTLLLQKDQV